MNVLLKEYAQYVVKNAQNTSIVVFRTLLMMLIRKLRMFRIFAPLNASVVVLALILIFSIVYKRIVKSIVVAKHAIPLKSVGIVTQRTVAQQQEPVDKFIIAVVEATYL